MVGAQQWTLSLVTVSAMASMYSIESTGACSGKEESKCERRWPEWTRHQTESAMKTAMDPPATRAMGGVLGYVSRVLEGGEGFEHPSPEYWDT